MASQALANFRIDIQYSKDHLTTGLAVIQQVPLVPIDSFCRYALVAAVSSFDRFMHAIIAEKLPLILGSSLGLPDALASFRITVSGAESAVSNTEVKAWIVESVTSVLGREPILTTGAISSRLSIITRKSVWQELEAIIGPGVKARWQFIANRRNQIVHEADWDVSAQSRRAITEPDIGLAIDFIIELAEAIDGMV